MRISCLCLLLTPAVFCSPTASAQDACLEREIPVSVVTLKPQLDRSSGDVDMHLVTGLGAQNFSASYHHGAVRILSASVISPPMRLVVVLDASGSMLAPPRYWQLALDVANQVIAGASPEIPIAFVEFEKKVDRTIPFTLNRSALSDAIQTMRLGVKAFPNGTRSTALWDALEAGRRLFGEPRMGDVIYVISDGDDDASKIQPRDLEKNLLASGVRLFEFGFQYGGEPDLIIGPSTLKQLTEVTGGLEIVVTKPVNDNGFGTPRLIDEKSGIPTVLHAILAWQIQHLRTFYLLKLQLPEPVTKPDGWKLQVTNMPGKKSGSFELAYPRKLMPCTTAAGTKSSKQ